MAFGLFALCGVISGCSEPTGQISGTITWQQQPVANAEILITSTANADDQFSGVSGPDGKYQVSYRTGTGLAPGAYQVRITRYVLPGGKPLPQGEEGEVLINSGRAVRSAVVFKQEIVAGANTVDFELTKGQQVSAE